MGGWQAPGATPWQSTQTSAWTPKLFALVPEPPGVEVSNQYEALSEEELEEEIPMSSLMEYPLLSMELEPPKKKRGKMGVIKKKPQKEKKESRRNGDGAECSEVRCQEELYPLIREESHWEQPELNAVSDARRWMTVCPTTGYSKVKSVLDSGATDSCAPDCMCPEVKSQPSEGSKRGQMYTAAGGKKIPNEGEKHLQMVTNANEVVQTNWQTVDITRPLSSVRQICMQGNRVIFGAHGGVIYNIETGHETPFGIEDNVYVLDLWLPPAQGFARQG